MVKILIIGEAYSEKDRLFDYPFVGAAGVELYKMLRDCQIVPEMTHKFPNELHMIKFWEKLEKEDFIKVTNVFNIKPENNDIDLFFTSAKLGLKTYPPVKPGKYLIPELFPHLQRLWKTIEETKPNLILALGKTACWAVLGEGKISELRGTIKLDPKYNIKVLPTYHAETILAQWNLRTIVLSDLHKAFKESSNATINRIERWLIVEPTIPEIEEWSNLPAEYYAVDIETKANLITMIGFARSSSDAIVIPFFDSVRGNYWENPKDEHLAWRLVEKLLISPVDKIFQNGIYDLTYILRAGIYPARCIQDTMLLHHAIYPEMLKGLGFLGSIYSSEIAWKRMRTKGNNLKRDE